MRKNRYSTEVALLDAGFICSVEVYIHSLPVPVSRPRAPYPIDTFSRQYALGPIWSRVTLARPPCVAAHIMSNYSQGHWEVDKRGALARMPVPWRRRMQQGRGGRFSGR